MDQLAGKSERHAFQAVVFVAALVPIAAGGAGIWQGPHMTGALPASSPDLESHFRYLSGLLLGIGLAFIYCAAQIRRRAALFRALGLIVIIGGVARVFAATRTGLPSVPHRFGLCMELLVMPALLLWLARIESRQSADHSKP